MIRVCERKREREYMGVWEAQNVSETGTGHVQNRDRRWSWHMWACINLVASAPWGLISVSF